MNRADKVIEIIGWMTKQGYDRKAAQEVAPIIVKYLEQHESDHSDEEAAFNAGAASMVKERYSGQKIPPPQTRMTFTDYLKSKQEQESNR